MKKSTKILTGLAAAALTYGALMAFMPGSFRHFGMHGHRNHAGTWDRHCQHDHSENHPDRSKKNL